MIYYIHPRELPDAPFGVQLLWSIKLNFIFNPTKKVIDNFIVELE